jgi:hypothetical protein
MLTGEVLDAAVGGNVPSIRTPGTLGISACSGCCGLRVPCLSWCLFSRLRWRCPGMADGYGSSGESRVSGAGSAVVVAAERAAAMVMARVTLPGVHVTFPGVPLAAVVPAAPPAAGSRRPGRDLRGGSGLDGGSSARGCTGSTTEPGSPRSFPPPGVRGHVVALCHGSRMSGPAHLVISRHSRRDGRGSGRLTIARAWVLYQIRCKDRPRSVRRQGAVELARSERATAAPPRLRS